MNFKSDIISRVEIERLVDTFYGNVRKDDLLAPIFEELIQDRWEEHLEKMYRFWQTVVLDEHTYHGAPFPPHARMPIDSMHFQRWIGLFEKTLDDLFEGERADKAKWQGRRMAQLFESKIHYLREAQTGFN